jgi:hypothetical protein
MLMRFSIPYFMLAVLLFIIEVLIAVFVRDNFVRPYLGDVLVVILIYCFVRSFLIIRPLPLAGFVLLFAFIIEFLQYIHIVEKLGLEKSKIMSTILGTSFAVNDLFAYTAGVLIILVAERLRPKTDQKSRTGESV